SRGMAPDAARIDAMIDQSRARASILGRIRQSLKHRPADAAAAFRRLEAELLDPRPNLIPARARLPVEGQRGLFLDMVRESAASVSVIRAIDEVPDAIADYLKSENLPAPLR